jgi:hypothetical protein
LYRKQKFVISIAVIIIVSLSIIAPLIRSYNTNYQAIAQSQTATTTTTISPAEKKITVGAWVPAQFHLEEMQGERQINAIYTLMRQGFNEYYFVMRNFDDPQAVKATEKLVSSADNTGLKIVIILLPPSEGGYNGNYNWKGWMSYFNSLKERHSSFQGFAIDDFNAIEKIRRYYIRNNVNYFISANLSNALHYYKNKDVQFYPVIYLETGAFETIRKEYNKFTAGIILVSTSYYNVTYLEDDLIAFSKMFENKPVKYIIYTTKNSANYSPPSDRLVMATLSIATRVAGGIIIYVNTNHHVIQDYLHNVDDPQYISTMATMERLQLKDEILKSRRDIIICIPCLY